MWYGADCVPPTTLILGAGLAGLGTAHTLDQAGADYRVLEAEDRVGGLARSSHRDGFTFDATGHWLHLRDPEVKALVEDLLGDDAVWVARSAWIHTHETFLPYPFQTNTWALPPEVRYECLMGYIEARFGEGGRALREGEPKSFREFVLRELGEGIGRHFMFPYNEKLWTVDLDTLSAEWTGRFVPRPSVEQVVRGALGADTAVQGYNARFVYPREGGIQVIPDRLAARLTGPIDLADPVTAVDTGRQRGGDRLRGAPRLRPPGLDPAPTGPGGADHRRPGAGPRGGGRAQRHQRHLRQRGGGDRRRHPAAPLPVGLLPGVALPLLPRRLRLGGGPGPRPSRAAARSTWSSPTRGPSTAPPASARRWRG